MAKGDMVLKVCPIFKAQAMFRTDRPITVDEVQCTGDKCQFWETVCKPSREDKDGNIKLRD
jgi:hypothetical protein